MFGPQSAENWRGRLQRYFSRSKTDAISIEELRALLVEADLSPAIVDCLLEEGKKYKTRDEMKAALTTEFARVLAEVHFPKKEIPVPGAILLFGVNGAGKTTLAAKLAKKYQDEGKNVVLAAADTFRAGAVEQLKTWGSRLGLEVISQKPGADPTSVVFDAWQRARAVNALLIADTAGRLHTKQPLVEELKKMIRILGKDGSGAPHECLLVLDGTTGRNATAQSQEFLKAAPITGFAITKLDGTSKGGGAVCAAVELLLPIRYLGTGETVDDLVTFDAWNFAQEFFRE